MARIEVRPEATDQFGFDPAAAHAARLQARVGESCLELLALLPVQLCLPLGEREPDGRDALAVQLGTSDQPQDFVKGRLGLSVRGDRRRILGSGVGRGGADQRVTQEGAQFGGRVRRESATIRASSRSAAARSPAATAARAWSSRSSWSMAAA